MIQIRYYKSKDVSSVILFNFFNYVVVYTPLDLGNKILTLKWTISISNQMEMIPCSRFQLFIPKTIKPHINGKTYHMHAL
jgi:hypothetical protein